MRLLAIIFSVCFCCKPLFAQKVIIPKWMASPAPGEYIGISFADAPQELSLLSAILAYVVSNEVECSYKSMFSATGGGDMDIQEEEGSSDFIYSGTLGYDIVRQAILPSGEHVVVLTEGKQYQVSVQLAMRNMFLQRKESGEAFCNLVDDLQCEMQVFWETSGQMMIWRYVIDKEHPYGISSCFDKEGKYESYGNSVSYQYQRIPLNLSQCLQGNMVCAKTELANNLAGAWNQVLCDVLLTQGYKAEMARIQKSISEEHYQRKRESNNNEDESRNYMMRQIRKRSKTPVMNLYYDRVFSILLQNEINLE